MTETVNDVNPLSLPLEWCEQCKSFHRKGWECVCKKTIRDLEQKVSELRGRTYDLSAQVERLQTENTRLQSSRTDAPST